MIFLLRHGEIAVPPGRPFVGQSDLPLTQEGRRQALLWRRSLAGLRFERVFSSDLPRCLETADLIFGGESRTGGENALSGLDEPLARSEPDHGRAPSGASPAPAEPTGPTCPTGPIGPTPTPLPALREISLGAWEGLTVEEVRRRFPGQWEARGQDILGARPEGGESFADLRERVLPAFEAVAASARPGANVLVVAHAGVNRIVLCRVLGLDPARLMRLGQDYGALNLIDLDAGSPRLLGLNLRPGSLL